MNYLMCFAQEKLANHSGIGSTFQIGVQFKHLHFLLRLILDFGDGLLQDLLAMYRTVSGLPFIFNCLYFHSIS